MKESQNTEWKESWRDEYLKWICGFANAQGGVLVIGKNDRGLPVGIADAEGLLETLPNKIRDLLGIVADINLLNEAGHELIEIKVLPYPTPISYKGQYHYRSGSTKQELKGAALERFLLRKHGRHWDGAPIPYVSAKDLDPRALKYFREQALQAERLSAADLRLGDQKLLEKLHLIENGFLKKAAILLFHPDPEYLVTGAHIKIGYFESESEVRYHDEIHGPLLLQIDLALDVLLLKYLKAMISYRGIHRVETYPVPRVALREAMLNAIIHKDYGSGAPIQIRVYDHKITVGNASVLPEDWTVQDLTQEHESRPFNPDIAHVFFRAGQIETWGRGIEKIFDACAAAGLPEPRYGDTGATLRLTFPFAPPPIITPEPEKTREKPREKTREKTREKILGLLLEKPQLSTADLAELVGITRKGIEWQIKHLKQEGVLERIGSARAGYWKVNQE